MHKNKRGILSNKTLYEKRKTLYSNVYKHNYEFENKGET